MPQQNVWITVCLQWWKTSTPDYVQNDADIINQHVNLNVRLGRCSPIAISLQFERRTQHKKQKTVKIWQARRFSQAKACQMWDWFKRIGQWKRRSQATDTNPLRWNATTHTCMEMFRDFSLGRLLLVWDNLSHRCFIVNAINGNNTNKTQFVRFPRICLIVFTSYSKI